MDLVRRALLVGLRTLADELEAGQLDPAEVLGAIAPQAPPAPVAPSTPPAESPRPRRKTQAKSARRSAEVRDLREPELPESAQIAAQLIEAHGSPQAVADRFGFSQAMALGRWSKGGPCSPATLERLRAAAAAGPPPG